MPVQHQYPHRVGAVPGGAHGSNNTRSQLRAIAERPSPLIPERDRYAQLLKAGLLILLAWGCWRVLQPFSPAILFAVVVAVSTWPAYRWLLRRLHGRRRLASALSSMMVLLAAVLPAALLVVAFGEGASWLLGLLEHWEAGSWPAAPAGLARIPLLGAELQRIWTELHGSHDGLGWLLDRFGGNVRDAALATGRVAANGLMQGALAVPMLYFLYYHGGSLARAVRSTAQRLAGDRAASLLRTAHDVLVATMFSVIGAALAQACVAILGFLLAGVPNALFLGGLVFLLSMIPIGPPFIWGGAALWLMHQGHTGWALFMVIYGVLCISSIDNLVTPLLISRSSQLPFALTFVGVIGGVLAYGVMGLFLGPMLLALAAHLWRTALDGPPLESGGSTIHHAGD